MQSFDALANQRTILWCLFPISDRTWFVRRRSNLCVTLYFGMMALRYFNDKIIMDGLEKLHTYNALNEQISRTHVTDLTVLYVKINSPKNSNFIFYNNNKNTRSSLNILWRFALNTPGIQTKHNIFIPSTPIYPNTRPSTLHGSSWSIVSSIYFFCQTVVGPNIADRKPSLIWFVCDAFHQSLKWRTHIAFLAESTAKKTRFSFPRQAVLFLISTSLE